MQLLSWRMQKVYPWIIHPNTVSDARLGDGSLFKTFDGFCVGVSIVAALIRTVELTCASAGSLLGAVQAAGLLPDWFELHAWLSSRVFRIDFPAAASSVLDPVIEPVFWAFLPLPAFCLMLFYLVPQAHVVSLGGIYLPVIPHLGIIVLLSIPHLD